MDRREFLACVVDACQRYETNMAHAFRRALGVLPHDAAPDREAPRELTSAELEAEERRRRYWAGVMHTRIGACDRAE